MSNKFWLVVGVFLGVWAHDLLMGFLNFGRQAVVEWIAS